MSTAAKLKNEPRIRSIEVTDAAIIAVLADGRTITVPLWWSWRLELASPAQRANFVIAASGYGVHWPDVDEDISARGLLMSNMSAAETLSHRR